MAIDALPFGSMNNGPRNLRVLYLNSPTSRGGSWTGCRIHPRSLGCKVGHTVLSKDDIEDESTDPCMIDIVFRGRFSRESSAGMKMRRQWPILTQPWSKLGSQARRESGIRSTQSPYLYREMATFRRISWLALLGGSWSLKTKKKSTPHCFIPLRRHADVFPMATHLCNKMSRSSKCACSGFTCYS
jgi:hypothetical protein